MDGTFWVTYVPQILQQEPTARHAVLAISALYEDFVETLPQRASGRLDDSTGLTARLESSTTISSRTAYALKHYNSAIRMVLEDHISNVDALLTVSLLFTCIELLRGGVDAAAKHCQHGIRVHKNGRLPPELSPAFHQLGFFSNTFDTSSTLKFSEFSDSKGNPCLTAVDEMRTLGQAGQALDAIMACGANLLRLVAQNRTGENTLCSLQDLKTERFHLHRALGLWWEGFTTIRRRLTAIPPVRDPDAAGLRLLEARWLVSNILESSCLADSETIFDQYLWEFRRLVELATQEKAARDAARVPLPRFSFDMGYLPLLYIVGIKCRHLRTRIRALVLMKDLSCERETIWDACFIYAAAKWATEFEHGLSLDEERMQSAASLYPDEQLACDADRIVGFRIAGNANWGVDPKGHPVVRRRVCYHVFGPGGTVGPLWEYMTVVT